MRLLVCGDRKWTDERAMARKLKPVIHLIEVLMHGDADGADKLSAVVARQLGLPEEKIKAFPADWDTFHKAAGPIRNQQMLTEGRPTDVYAFHHDLSKSKGTRDMVMRARKVLPFDRVWVSSEKPRKTLL